MVKFVFIILSVVSHLLVSNIAQAEIFKCNGSYQNEPCKSGEDGGVVTNLPQIKKYNWLKKDGPAPRGRLNVDSELSKDNFVKKIIEGNKEAEKLVTETDLVKTAKRPQRKSNTLILDNKVQAKVLSVVQEVSEFRFTVVDYAKRYGKGRAKERVASLWSNLEEACVKLSREDLGKSGDMCKRGFGDLVSLRKIL